MTYPDKNRVGQGRALILLIAGVSSKATSGKASCVVEYFIGFVSHPSSD